MNNPEYDVKHVFPLRAGYKAIFFDPNGSSTITMRKLDDFTGFKKLIHVDSSKSPEPCDLAIDVSFIEELESEISDVEERRCCSICGELCSRQDMSSHGCIVENNADPGCRFLILPEYNQFYPIVHNGKEIMIGFNDAGEYLTYTTSIDTFAMNEKIFCPIETLEYPHPTKKTDHTAIKPALFKTTPAINKIDLPKEKKKNPKPCKNIYEYVYSYMHLYFYIFNHTKNFFYRI